MRLLDTRALVQVGDGPRHAQAAGDRPPTELQPLGGRFERGQPGRSQRLPPQLRTAQRTVERTLGPPLSLALARPKHALPNHPARLGDRRDPQQLAGRLPRPQDLEADTVPDRAGPSRAIPLATQTGAFAGAAGVAGKAAWARIGR